MWILSKLQKESLICKGLPSWTSLFARNKLTCIVWERERPVSWTYWVMLHLILQFLHGRCGSLSFQLQMTSSSKQIPSRVLYPGCASKNRSTKLKIKTHTHTKRRWQSIKLFSIMRGGRRKRRLSWSSITEEQKTSSRRDITFTGFEFFKCTPFNCARLYEPRSMHRYKLWTQKPKVAKSNRLTHNFLLNISQIKNQTNRNCFRWSPT